MMTVAVLVALLCLRRVRPGEEAKRGGAEDAERDAENRREQNEILMNCDLGRNPRA